MTLPGSAAAVPSVLDASLTIVSVVGLAMFAYCWLREKGSKGQIVGIFLIAVALAGGAVFADAVQNPCDLCKGVEPWTWDWFLRQCFNCD